MKFEPHIYIYIDNLQFITKRKRSMVDSPPLQAAERAGGRLSLFERAGGRLSLLKTKDVLDIIANLAAL